jgi:hypothetical protein
MKLSMNTWFLSRKNAPNWPFVSGVNSTWTKYQHPANEDLKKLTKCSVSQECRTSHVDHARSSPNINGLSSIYRKSWFFAITFCYPANLPLYKKKNCDLVPLSQRLLLRTQAIRHGAGQEPIDPRPASTGWGRIHGQGFRRSTSNGLRSLVDRLPYGLKWNPNFVWW